MANPITRNMAIGTIGELLVQLRLLQYGVQAAAPLKDSGNDLIALRGYAARAIQVKTTTRRFNPSVGLPNKYHLLALVRLHGHYSELSLDRSEVYLLHRDQVGTVSFNDLAQLRPFAISQERVDALFVEP